MKLKDIVIGQTVVKTPTGAVGIVAQAEKIVTSKKGRPATLLVVSGVEGKFFAKNLSTTSA